LSGDLQPSGYERGHSTGKGSSDGISIDIRCGLFAFGCGVLLVIYWLAAKAAILEFRGSTRLNA
jgi:hypothetical protein